MDAKGVAYISIGFTGDTLMLVHEKPYQATPDSPSLSNLLFSNIVSPPVMCDTTSPAPLTQLGLTENHQLSYQQRHYYQQLFDNLWVLVT